jgi:hypothetical protein
MQQQLASGSLGSSITPRPDGTFEWPNVMPGRYTLSARPRIEGPLSLSRGGDYGTLSLIVTGDDVTNLVITTTPSATVRGHFVFDTGAPPANLRPETVAVLMAAGGFFAGSATTNADWTFELANLAGAGTFRLRPTPPTGWFLKSVLFNSKDVTDIPTDFSGARDVKDLQIVLTQKQTQITGRLTEMRNVAAVECVVIVFSEDRTLWTTQSRFVASARADQQGQIRVLGLPPGRYLAAAVDYLENGEERDPELLARLESAAQRVTLAEGETKSLTFETRDLVIR